MAIGESAGTVFVRIDGDASPLIAKFAQLQATSQAAGQRIAASLGSGLSTATGLVDQFGRAIQSGVSVPAAAAAPRITAMGTALVAVGNAGRQAAAGVQQFGQQTQSVVGLIPGLGRAAEHFINLIPGFGQLILKAFPVLGLIAFSESLFRIGKNAVELARSFDPVLKAEKEAEEGAKKWDSELKQVSQTLLDIERRNFEAAVGKAASDARDATAIEREVLALRAQKLAIETQISEQIRLQQKGREVPIAGGAAQGGRSFIESREIEAAPKRLEQLRRDLDKVQLQIASDQQRAGELSRLSLQASSDDTDKANKKALTDAREVESQRRKELEEGLSELEFYYGKRSQIVIRYLNAEGLIEGKYPDLARAVNEKLRAVLEDRNAMFQRITERGQKIQEEHLKKEQENASKLSDIADRGTELGLKIGEELADRAAKLSSATARGGEIAQDAGIQARRLAAERAYGAEVFHTLAQQIALERQEADLDEEQSRARITRLQVQLSGEDDVVKKKEIQNQIDQENAEIANRRYESETRIAELKQRESLAGRLAQSGKQIPGQLGGALSAGIVGGHIGQEIRRSLQGIGQQLLGDVFKTAIEKLIVELGIQRAATAVLTAVTSGNTIATLSNTIAIIKNTIVQIFHSIFPFADGGSPPVGVPSLVGERGPELFIPKESGVVIPNHMLTGYADGAGISNLSSTSTASIGAVHLHFPNARTTAQAAREMARAMPQLLKNANPRHSPYAI